MTTDAKRDEARSPEQEENGKIDAESADHYKRDVPTTTECRRNILSYDRRKTGSATLKHEGGADAQAVVAFLDPDVSGLRLRALL